MFQPVFMCFSPSLRLVAGGRGVKRDWYTTCSFFSLYSSKIEVSETYVFANVIT